MAGIHIPVEWLQVDFHFSKPDGEDLLAWQHFLGNQCQLHTISVSYGMASVTLQNFILYYGDSPLFLYP